MSLFKEQREVIAAAADQCGFEITGAIVIRILPRDMFADNQTFEGLMALAGFELERYQGGYFVGYHSLLEAQRRDEHRTP